MRSRLLLVLLAGLSTAAAAPKRPITETDLYAFRWIAAPQISPDGARIVYTLVTVNSKHDNYETSLWIIPAAGGGARQLTSGPHDSSARWSPDGRAVAFVRAPDQKDKDGKPCPRRSFCLPWTAAKRARSRTFRRVREWPGMGTGRPHRSVSLHHSAQGFRQEERCERRR
ncbi:MAG TPA: hypothetical protein VMR62_25180 [Bryobacteraceae bacterium]|jgi:dipeptidyl aminopeptidase/acylaminoacyl peptidase|nr:hypothetical protein [Bryobacteraceae bacterium]